MVKRSSRFGRSPLFLMGLLVAIAWGLWLPIVAEAGPSSLLPFLPQQSGSVTKLFQNNSQDSVIERCIYIDGRCVFAIAAPRSEIGTRFNYVQGQLTRIQNIYNQQNQPSISIYPEKLENINNIIVAIDDTKIRLMTVTHWDTQITGEDIDGRSQHIIDQLNTALQESREERQFIYLRQQGAIAVGILIISCGLYFLSKTWSIKAKKLRDEQQDLLPDNQNHSLISQLNIRKNRNLLEVQYRLLQLLETSAIAVGMIINLGLFPYTRMAQVWLLQILQYPLHLGLIAIATYLSIRLSYALIAKANTLLVSGTIQALTFISQESNRRLELRVNTFSRVMRSIVTGMILVSGLLVTLWSMGVNIAPLLAGAGIVGLAISLAAQNLLKDIINGFCIILEDQYAVGDVITVGTVGGLVENINLRITQVRDAEGRLITIPNSEIRIVANLSSHWSKADLNIPIAYQTDVNQALAVIAEVAAAMSQDELWRSQILENPAILGIDNFSERGVMIKVSIKTEPLKQWAIAREFRHRLKLAFDQHDIQIQPSQEIWLKSSP